MLADRDTPLAVELPERLISGPPQACRRVPFFGGCGGPCGLCLGLSGRRGWSFSTYEPPLGDGDTALLPDIVFRSQPFGRGMPPLGTRREIRVRPYDPGKRPAVSLEQDFAVLLVDAYRYLGGERLARYLQEVGNLKSVTERIDNVLAALYAVLPAHALSVPRLRYEPVGGPIAAETSRKPVSPVPVAILSGGSADPATAARAAPGAEHASRSPGRHRGGGQARCHTGNAQRGGRVLACGRGVGGGCS